SLCWLKPFHSFHEANIAFANEVEERHAKAFVLARDLDDQPQIGLDHLLSCLFFATLNAVGKRRLFLLAEQIQLADLTQVEFECARTGRGVWSQIVLWPGFREGEGRKRDKRRESMRLVPVRD